MAFATFMLSSSSSSSSHLLSSHLRVCPSRSNAQLSRQSVCMPITRCSIEKPLSSSLDGPNPNNTSDKLLVTSKMESSSSVKNKQQQPLKSSTMGATASPVTPSKVAPASFHSVTTFSGLRPETINGRLAMLEFVWVVAREIATHETVVEQVSSARFPILATMILFSSASLIPLLSSTNPNSHNFSPFNAQAELLNGRIAMIGFCCLILAEAIQGFVYYISYLHSSYKLMHGRLTIE